MRSLNDIIVDNSHWEEYERIKKANQARMARIEADEAKLLPRLRSLWGDGPTDARLIQWYRSADSVTKSLFQ